MARTDWTGGAADNNWNTAGNWSNGVPAANDTVVVRASCPATAGPTLNVDRQGDTAGAGLDLDLFLIEKGATCSVGASGTPLMLTSTKFIDRGDGALWFTSATGTGGFTTPHLAINSSKSKTKTLDDDGTASIDLINVSRGTVVLSGGMLAVAVLNIAYVNNQFADADVTVSSGSAAIVQCNMSGGQLAASSAITTLFMSGGIATIAVGNIATLVMSGSAQLKYNTDGGTITGARIMPVATLDMLNNERAKTITSLLKFPGAMVHRDLNQSIVTVTTNFEFGLDNEA